MFTRNKLILSVATAGIMMYGSSAFAEVNHAVGPFGSGKVTFTGTITNSPCDIASGDDDLTVKFGQISYRKLKEADATSDAKPVTIHLRNCSFDANTENKPGSAGKMSLVLVSFQGTAASGDKAYANTPGAGMATGVGVQLLDSSMAALTPSALASTGTTPQQLQAGDNQINLFARLINLGAEDSVTAGDIQTAITYTLTYK
ncbi:fimbrial protein StdA [Salmonella enterica subsp. enterica serovar Poona]|nr:fimbrial protein StdA [Salmonella enterica subsp. enterica serovar Poona]